MFSLHVSVCVFQVDALWLCCAVQFVLAVLLEGINLILPVHSLFLRFHKACRYAALLLGLLCTRTLVQLSCLAYVLPHHDLSATNLRTDDIYNNLLKAQLLRNMDVEVQARVWAFCLARAKQSIGFMRKSLIH